MKRLVAICCDASPAIGGGHVMRCLALADALAARAHRISLTTMTSGLHGIARRCTPAGEDCVLESGTDPRREGLARGR